MFVRLVWNAESSVQLAEHAAWFKKSGQAYRPPDRAVPEHGHLYAPERGRILAANSLPVGSVPNAR